MNVEQGFQLGDLRGLLRRRAPIAGAIAGGVFLVSLVIAGWLPNEYEAFTTLLVEPQTISKKLLESGVEESDLNERLHLMTMQILSRPRLSKIIDDLKLYPDMSNRMTREEVIDHMRSEIRVEPVLPELEGNQVARRNKEYEINTFRLLFKHENAATSAAVANRLANDFIAEHIKERVQVSGDTSDFIASELARLSGRIQEVEAKIARVKLENPGRLPEDFDGNQRLLEHAVDQLREAHRELATAQSDEAFYRQQALVSAAPMGSMNEADPAQRLKLLEMQLAAYRSRGFTDKHPDIIATEYEVKEIKRTLASSDGSEQTAASLAQQNAQAEAQRAALRIASAQELIDTMTQQVNELQQRLADTPRVAEQLAALDREYQHLFESFQQFSTKRLDAGVAANMELRQKGEQVRVLENAYPPPDATSPNRPLIVTLGAIFGLTLGAGLAILLEGTDNSFHQPQALQSALRIPVLSSIPAITLDADRAIASRRRMRVALASAIVTVAVLLTSGAGYVIQNGVLSEAPDTIADAASSAPAPGEPPDAAATPATPPAAPPATLPSVITPESTPSPEAN